MHRGSTQRIGAHPNACGTDAVHVDDAGQVFDIGHHEIVGMGRRGLAGRLVRLLLDPAVAVAQQSIGSILDPARDVRIRRTAVERVVLEPAVTGRVVGRGNHNAVSPPLSATAVIA